MWSKWCLGVRKPLFVSVSFSTAHTEFHYLFKFPRRAQKCLNLEWKLKPTFRAELPTKPFNSKRFISSLAFLALQTVTQQCRAKDALWSLDNKLNQHWFSDKRATISLILNYCLFIFLFELFLLSTVAYHRLLIVRRMRERKKCHKIDTLRARVSRGIRQSLSGYDRRLIIFLVASG